MMEVGAALRRARKSRGVTQEEVSAKAGKVSTFATKLEREGSNPEWESIRAYMEALGITWRDIAEAAGELEAEPAEQAPASLYTVVVEMIREIKETQQEVAELRREVERSERERVRR